MLLLQQMKNCRRRFLKTFQFVKEQVSNPLSAQILEFCESELFLETIQNSEVASSSNCCYEEQSSYTTNLSVLPNITKCSTLVDNATTIATSAVTTPTTNFSLVSEEEITKNDISISTLLDLTHTSHFTSHQYPFSDQDLFDLSLLQNQIPLTTNTNTTINDSIFSYTDHLSNDDHIVPIIQPTISPIVSEGDSLSSMPPSKCMRFNNHWSPNCSFVDSSINSYLPGSTECSETFIGNLFSGNDIDIQPHELDIQLGDNGGIFSADPLPCSYHSNELQALSNESQHLVNGGGNSTTLLAPEITSLESETFKVTNKLACEERKEKIHRYMKKRNERNFSKKIKYACRKTLADSRPRVRGRFAKNDEFGENNRTNNNHEEDTDEDVRSFNHAVVKEEEYNLNIDSSDIFAHITGVNSFKCNYPFQSWI